MDFRSIVLGDWQLFLDFIWNFVYSVWPVVIIFVAITAFGYLLSVVLSALKEMKR